MNHDETGVRPWRADLATACHLRRWHHVPFSERATYTGVILSAASENIFHREWNATTSTRFELPSLMG